MEVKKKKRNGAKKRGAWRIPRPLLLASAPLALMPLSAALMRTLVAAEGELGADARLWLSPQTLSFAGGMAFATLFCVAFKHSSRHYIIAHEMTHAVFGRLFGAKVSDLKVGEFEGSVRVSKENMLVLLAPYFFPVHVFLTLLLAVPLSLAAPVADSPVWRLFAFFVGLVWGHNFYWATNAVFQPQKDFAEYGRFFSINFILAGNLLALCLFVGIFTPLPWGRLPAIFGGEAIFIARRIFDMAALPFR